MSGSNRIETIIFNNKW